MSPLVNDANKVDSPQPGTTATGGKPQPTALEIAVTVNGARTVEGSEKREPFSENTQTVLVFATGAVIRLTSAVSTGQLLFLTNEKSRKEVVCQVVKANHTGANGYVELQFTEPAPGFWGLRVAAGTPNDRAKPSVPAPVHSLEAKLAEMKAKPLSAPAAEAAKPALEKPAPAVTETTKAAPNVAASVATTVVRDAVEPAAKPANTAKEIQAAPVVPAQPPENAVKIPTLSEFLTKSESAPERRKPAEKTAPPAAPQNKPQELQRNPAEQKTLTAALVDRMTKPAPTAGVPAVQNAAPGSFTFDFEAEEVKIPSWLEPLARNSATSGPTAETAARDAKTPEKIAEEIRHTEGPVSEHKSVADAPAAAPVQEYSEKSETVLSFSTEGPTPNFGSSLALDSRRSDVSSYDEAPRGSRKGLVLTLAAIVLLAIAAGAWYWFSTQTTNASDNRNAVSPANVEPPSQTVTPSRAPAATVERCVKSDSAAQAAESFSRVPTPASTVSSAAKATEPVSRNEVASAAPLRTDAAATKRPELGAVRLAAPVASRKNASAANSDDSEPALEANPVSGSDANGMNLLANKGKQPVAPIPVGGDVKQARLLSSVPPVYPALARTQRLSGGVTIDALIDANGRVTAMKVISGPALLHQAAMDALKQWKYQPATLNGQPMPMHLSVTIQFRLQ